MNRPKPLLRTACFRRRAVAFAVVYCEDYNMKDNLERLRCRSCGYERVLDRELVNEISAKLGNNNQHLTSADINQNLLRFKCSRCNGNDIALLRPLPSDQKNERAPKSPKTNGELKESEIEEAPKPVGICLTCGKPIPLERLRAVRNTQRCVRCQNEFEKGTGIAEEEISYCKRCGAKMVWRLRTSVRPSKYFLACSNYPKCKYIISGSW